MIEEDEYLKKRLDDQINWYSNKSDKNKKWYKCLKVIEFVLSASIPIITITNSYYAWFNCWSELIIATIGAIGAILTIIASLHGLSKFHENWISYRSTSEALKREKILYLANADIYRKTDTPFQLLVSRVEALISKETGSWTAQNSDSGSTN